MFKNDNIEKRLKKSFILVSAIMAITALLGLVALLTISNRYSYALINFGFAQGDIGKAMFEFADIRSSLRAAIGYDDSDAIDNVVKQHNQSKILFEQYFAKVEDSIVSKSGRTTYDEIKMDLEEYWKLDDKIMSIGATTDREYCKQAQDIALEELAPVYNNIYSKLEELLEVKVEEGNKLSSTLTALNIIFALIIIGVTIVAYIFSTKIGKAIAKGISEPMKQLGNRFKMFATGDLSSPFPVIEANDEVSDMIKDATDMANILNLIINDIGTLLGQMEKGNYAVKSSIKEKYTNDFQKMINSMIGLRDQMTNTLLSIREASS